MPVRHVGNNWVPLLYMSFLFLFTGAISMMTDRGNGAAPGSFVLGYMLTNVASALWLWRHPSWGLAPRYYYLYLTVGTLIGVLLSAMLPFLNGTGPWLVIGGSLLAYGIFERLRLLVTLGGTLVFTGLLAAFIHVELWGGAFQLITAFVLAFAANRLYVIRNGRRRESADSDPSFIGTFQEYDHDEGVGFSR